MKDDARKQEEEREANLFALCLLMPEHLLRADLKRMGGVDIGDDRQLQDLADRYQVSVGHLALRLGMLGIPGFNGGGDGRL